MLFRSMSVESIVGYLRSFGIWAVVISFLLMMFQSIIAPLPAFLITFANAAVLAGGKARCFPGPVRWREHSFASTLRGLQDEIS